MWSRFKTLDPWLYILPIFLAGCGIAGIYSITYGSVQNGLHDLVIKQLIFVAIGIVIMILMTFIDYRSLKGWAPWIYLISLFLILLLLFLPSDSFFVIKEFGAKRWLGAFGFRFQPSEAVKITILITLAAIFSHIHGTLRWRTVILAILVIALPIIIIIKQPDLGTAIIIFLSSFLIFLVAKLTKWQWLAISIVLGVLVSTIFLSYYKVKPFDLVLYDYQRQRISTFLNPDSDPKHQGYNILQSVIAVGSGGLFGKGLGYGSQSQLYFLPVAHTDFIFAALAESWGFAGSVTIIIIYGLLLVRIIYATRIAKDSFGLLLATGIFGIILFQVLINIGMNIKLFPVTGIPLPFLSSGGTSILGTFFSIGIIQSIVMRYKKINF